MKKNAVILSSVLVFIVQSGCVTMKVEPIHITMDVNVRVQVEKEVDDFFEELDQASATILDEPES